MKNKYFFRLSVVGTTLTEHVNGTQALSTTDSSRTSDVAGLIRWKTFIKLRRSSYQLIERVS